MSEHTRDDWRDRMLTRMRAREARRARNRAAYAETFLERCSRGGIAAAKAALARKSKQNAENKGKL